MRYNPATDQAKTYEELAFTVNPDPPEAQAPPSCTVCGGPLDAGGFCIDLGGDLSRFEGVA